MTKSEYAAYLRSEHWLAFRKSTLSERPSCERCGLPRWLASVAYDQDLHVHHRSYRDLGNEEPWDVEVLCRRCHEIETFGHSNLRVVPQVTCSICGQAHWDRYVAVCELCQAFMDVADHYNRQGLSNVH